MKFPTLTGEIVIVKADQNQARQCYTKSLKVAPYPPIWEPTRCHPIVAEGTQVMIVDEGSQIRALTIYQSSQGNEFDIDLWDDTFDKGLKPIEELVQLQLRPKSRQCTRLSMDLSSHEHRCIADVLHRNADLFAWQPSNMPRIYPGIICHKLAIWPQVKPIS